jgi:hypothetical protein
MVSLTLLKFDTNILWLTSLRNFYFIITVISAVSLIPLQSYQWVINTLKSSQHALIDKVLTVCMRIAQQENGKKQAEFFKKVAEFFKNWPNFITSLAGRPCCDLLARVAKCEILGFSPSKMVHECGLDSAT